MIRTATSASPDRRATVQAAARSAASASPIGSSRVKRRSRRGPAVTVAARISDRSWALSVQGWSRCFVGGACGRTPLRLVSCSSGTAGTRAGRGPAMAAAETFITGTARVTGRRTPATSARLSVAPGCVGGATRSGRIARGSGSTGARPDSRAASASGSGLPPRAGTSSRPAATSPRRPTGCGSGTTIGIAMRGGGAMRGAVSVGASTAGSATDGTAVDDSAVDDSTVAGWAADGSTETGAARLAGT